MNKQLIRTLKAISPEIPRFIRQLEKSHSQQATITIEKIDRPLLLTRGEVQEMTDFMYSNPEGLLKELYFSNYYALYDNELTFIPSDTKIDFKQTAWGLDTVDFLSDRDSTKLKAIIHIDTYSSFNHNPHNIQLHWFKIQVATPKNNKSVAELVQVEVDRKEKLATIRSLRRQ